MFLSKRTKDPKFLIQQESECMILNLNIVAMESAKGKIPPRLQIILYD